MQLRKTDLFTFIHKALRSIIYNAASNLQSADFTDVKEIENLLASLRHDLDLLHEHAVNEDNIIFPEIANNEPYLISELNDEHKVLEEKLHKIKTQIEKTNLTTDNEKQVELGTELNNLFNDFAASYLAHMNHEEATVLQASFKYLNDAELIAIRTRIQTQIPSERYKTWLHWMLKSLNNSELIGLLGGMKASAPAHVFENVVGVAQAVIENKKWNKIRSRLMV